MSRPPKKHIFKIIDKAVTTLDCALQYADLGWAVLPVWGINHEDGTCRCGLPNDAPGHKPGKHPLATLTPRGHLDSTINPDIIRDWFSTDPTANIGISLADSGLIALDIDPRNGGDQTLEKIEQEHGVLYSDCVAVTQSGGEHRLFRAEENTSYPSSIGPGLDLKHHGYIVVAPSMGELGPYKWKDNQSPIASVNPVTPSELPKFISDKARAKTEAYEIMERSGVPVATAQTFDDLREALTFINSDPYDTWVQVGMALKPYGENGYSVWMDWSSRSPKFDASSSRKKWDVLDHPHSITFKSIFRAAIDNGWTSSATGRGVVEEVHPLSLQNDQGSGSHSVTTFEYIFNDFMSTGINVLAGAPGVGKTTLAIPLALSVAHIYPVDYELIPSIRRNVIIITESVVQVQRIIYSVATFGNTGARQEDFDSVKVIPARRLKADIVAQVAEEYREWTYPNEMADGGTYHALPLIMFDTANSVFDIESENDNSEVGKVMASLKENFDGFPIIIIAHTAKALGSGESDMLSPRGASAWTGDAQGVYTMFRDSETEDRILQATKVRFPTDYQELTFTLVSNSEHHKDVLGYDDILYFTHAYARPLKDGERKSSKDRAKLNKANEKLQELCDALVRLIRKEPGQSRSYYERLSATKGGVSGSQSRKTEAIDHLIGEGLVENVPLPDQKGRQTHGLFINEQKITNDRLDDEDLPF